MPSRPRRRSLLVFPHQLFAEHPGLAEKPTQIYLIEDSLFFGDPHHPARFHKQKLWLHRASMKRYEARLKETGHNITYLDHLPGGSSLQQLFEKTLQHTDEDLLVAEVHDFLLQKRLDRFCSLYSKNIESLKTP
ncbi:MAG: cryptochrome/photolyase family protein, partial [Roseibacillus sp.]|nr:cryptochrome/photolyase family protein [Roseibacillus sp.]